MLQKDLLSLEHLKISEVKEGYFLHVHSEDDWMITSWNEGDDIRQYVGFQCLYAPIKEEYPDYRIISKEEHDRREQERMRVEMEDRKSVTGPYASNISK